MSQQGYFAIFTLTVVALAGCGESGAPNVAPQVEVARKLRVAIDSSAEATDTDTEEEVVVRTGWATIKGRFVVAGSPSKLPNLKVDKDQTVCAPGGAPVPDQSVVLGPDNGLANLAVYAVGLGEEGENVHESAATAAESSVLFDQKNCIFLTRLCAMQVGQTLILKNSDSVMHNTAIAAKRAGASNQTLGAGLSGEYVPKKGEKSPVQVTCSVHPWMRAYLFPHENGYVSVTPESGEFEIKNLPAGIDLRIQVWHERLKKFDDIQVNGEAVTWKRGAVKLNAPLEPDEVRELQIEIPAELFGG